MCRTGGIFHWTYQVKHGYDPLPDQIDSCRKRCDNSGTVTHIFPQYSGLVDSLLRSSYSHYVLSVFVLVVLLYPEPR